MPTLSIPNTFSANTLAQSSQVNANFNAVATLLNSTKLDNTNIQTGGINAANLASSSITKAKLDSTVADASTIEVDATNGLQLKDAGTTLAKLAAAVAQALSPTGSMTAFAGTSAPTGWLICDGSAVSRTTYSALYTAIGAAYGTGDGSTTFNLPDTRGRFLRGLMSISTVSCSSSASGNAVTATAHGFKHSGVRVRVTGTPVTGLSTATDYYIIFVDADTVSFATTHGNAISGTKITISGTAGSMVIQQWEDPDGASREACAPGGNSGQNVGTVQEDGNKAHGHTVSVHSGGGQADLGSSTRFAGQAGGAMGSSQDQNATCDGGVVDNGTGVSDARPRNMAVNYIIKT